MRRVALASLTLVLALSALPPGGAAPGVLDTKVHISNFAFNPDSVTILVGESVTWDNQDVATHTATADDASFDSGNLGNGATYTHTFTEAGTVAYHCNIHASMHGKVLVVDPNAKPDLVVSQFSASETVPGVASKVAVSVRNLGSASAAASVARVVYERGDGAALVGDLAVPSLGPGEQFDGALDWSTVGLVGDFTLHAVADVNGDVGEANEANNGAIAQASVLVHGVPGIDVLHLLGLS